MNNLNLSPLALLALIVPVILITVACGSDDEELSRADVEEIVRSEMAEAPTPPLPEPGVTAGELDEIIRAALADAESGLSGPEVEAIVQNALEGIPELQDSIDAAQLEEAISKAIENSPQLESGLSDVAVNRIVEAAIAGIPEPPAGLTAAEVKEIVQDAIASIPEPDPGLTNAEVELIERNVMVSIPPRSAPADYTKFFVEKAISNYEIQGLDATLAHYNRPDSVDGQWYVFIIDENGLVVGHPDSERLGLDLKDWAGTDANGYRFGPDMLSATEDGKWVSYVYRNPESGGIGSNSAGTFELKNVWVVRHDGLLFASGWYVDADDFTKALVATAIEVFRAGGLEGVLAYFASPEIEFAGLRSAIEYYNTAYNVEGDWFAFIADANGTIIDHYDRALVGSSIEDLFGTDRIDATAVGNWVTTENLRVWVVGDNGMTFGSGWSRTQGDSGG